MAPMFVDSRNRGIDESESAEIAGATAKCRKPHGLPTPSTPTTNTASSSPSEKSVSSAIANPRSGWSPRQSTVIACSLRRNSSSIALGGMTRTL